MLLICLPSGHGAWVGAGTCSTLQMSAGSRAGTLSLDVWEEGTQTAGIREGREKEKGGKSL